jgi:NAD(P)H-hydrate epimerase
LKLVTAAEMRSLEEQAARQGISTAQLMENAGRAVAEAVRRRLGGARGMRIVVLVGPGNNGGDGLVAARHLHDFGEDVFVYLLAPRESDSNLEAVRAREIEVAAAASDPGLEALKEALSRADAIIDAVLGTGRARPLDGTIAQVWRLLDGAPGRLFAVDLPTGVDADSGAADPLTVAADVTLALGFSKVGLHSLPASRFAGEVEVLDIGIPAAAGAAIRTELLTPEWVQARLPPRPAEANKGTFGRVLIVAGSVNYTGAAALTALGALRAGAGLVTLACIAEVRAAVAPLLPEATYLVLQGECGHLAASAGDTLVREIGRYDALIVGPGLGANAETASFVRGVLAHPALAEKDVVVDADALNALSRWPLWPQEVRGRLVLTPHPGELSRLVRKPVSELQEQRLPVCEHYASEWRQTLLLKGAHTVIASPEGAKLVSPFATAALATGGTGDVLAGVIGGLLAQRVPPFDAAGVGAFLHGAAALELAQSYGESGLLASELSAAVARQAARLRRRT